MVFVPVGVSRVPNLLAQGLALENIVQRQRELTLASAVLATGRRINVPGDDPAGAVQATVLQALREENDQFLTNLDFASRSLGSAEAVLRRVTDVIDAAKSVAIRQATTAINETERRAGVAEIDALIDELLIVANNDFLRRSELGGQDVTGPAFVREAAGIVFTGNNAAVLTLAARDIALALNVSADRSIGASSAVSRSGDLDPAIAGATRLSELNDGAGVVRGVITIDVGGGPVLVDLSSADTIQDVLDTINAAVGGPVATINVAGNGLQLTAGGPITVRDTAGGATARDLGILAESVASPLIGRDLDPELRLTTPLALLRSGAGVNLADGVQITNGPFAATIDFTGATTVEDVLNRINAADVRVRAEINAERNGIDVLSVLSGGSFSLTETSLAGTTAQELGIRSTTLESRLADFNDGAGVQTVSGADIRITTHSGAIFDVDLSEAETIGDVATVIQTATGGAVVVDENPLGGIRLTDTTIGGGNFSVSAVNNSPAADHLGILADVGPANEIVGANNHRARVVGLFDTLLRLRQTIADGDVSRFEVSGRQLDQDADRVLAAAGAVGAQLRALDFTADRLRGENLGLSAQTADVLEPDFAEAVTSLLTQQTALQAALAATGRLLQLSLLDFI